MIAEGTYRASAVDCALGMTGTGKEQIAIMFETIGTEHQPAQRITWYGYFTDNTFERTVQSLRHIGWKGNDLSVFGLGVPEDCHNQVEIVVEHETDDKGDRRAKVRWVNSGNGLAVKERMDEPSARAFAARMKARVAALGTTKSTTTAQAPRGGRDVSADARPTNFGSEPPAITDEDIPF